jgi:dTDP-4-dehydrorhamnose reductase
MKILVTGSNGLLGQKLSHLIQQHSSFKLIATARSKSVINIEKGEFYEMDICNEASLERVFSKVKPDVVINTAAMTMVDKCETERDACWDANVLAMEKLVRACETVKAHLVHVSTDFIFDGSHGPLDETEKPAPVNFYGESKLAGEKIVMNSKLDCCICRTVLVYGITNDLSRPNIVLWVKESLEKGKQINVVNDQWRTPTLAEDLAMGCFLAATKKAKGIYNISGKDFITPFDIAIKTADYFKLDKSLIKPADSNTFKQPARRPLITGFIIDKARKELGYEPHSFDEGLKILAQQISASVVS